MPRYFFDKDDDGHWYMIPVEKREQWKSITSKEDYWEYDGWSELSDFAIDNPFDIEFENPLHEDGTKVH